MGCCGKEFSSGSCVCDVLREIDRAQEDISNNNNCCDSSCDRSISDLLGETEEERNGLDTVPVILYCRDSCKPFKGRSEEHTSELQSRGHLVCRLLLEKKNNSQKR